MSVSRNVPMRPFTPARKSMSSILSAALNAWATSTSPSARRSARWTAFPWIRAGWRAKQSCWLAITACRGRPNRAEGRGGRRALPLLAALLTTAALAAPPGVEVAPEAATEVGAGHVAIGEQTMVATANQHATEAALAMLEAGGTAVADRKSTRLNSSHVAISYA